MSGTSSASSQGSNVFPHSFGLLPNEGPRSVRTQYSWADPAKLTWTEDFSQIMDLGKFTMVQSMFVDNSANASAVSVYVLGTQQTIVIPGQAQGVFPLYFTGNPLFTISCATSGPVATSFHFHNVPQPMFVWSASQAGGSAVVAAQGAPGNAAGAWPVAGYFNAAGVILSDGQRSVLQLDAYGSLKTSDSSLAGVITASSVVAKPIRMALTSGNYTQAGVVLTDGQVAAIQLDSVGNAKSLDATLLLAKTGVAPGAPGTASLLTSGVYRLAPATLADGQAVAMQVDAVGSLRTRDVVLDAAVAGAGVGAAAASAVLVSGVYLPGVATLTSGQSVARLTDAAGRALVSTGALVNATGAAVVDSTLPGACYCFAATIPTIVNMTDVVVLAGSAGKTVQVLSISVGALSGAAATNIQCLLTLRSTANVGGSPTVGAIAKFSQSSPAASATVGVYGVALPTSLGTSAGNVGAANVSQQPVATATPNVVFDFSKNTMAPIVLSGASQFLAVNFNASNLAGGCNVSIVWREV